MKDYEGLIIKKGGSLFQSKWEYNTKKGVGTYVEQDITSYAYRKLFEPCIIDSNVILRDLFLLIVANQPMFSLLFGNWCAEITNEVLQDTNYPLKNTEIKYLELYKCVEIEENYTLGITRPIFHGIGYDQTPYSLMMSSGYMLQSCLITLKTDVPVYVNCAANNYSSPPAFIIPNIIFTLGEILEAVIWELSFLGSPKMRDDTKTEIHKRVEQLTNEVSSHLD